MLSGVKFISRDQILNEDDDEKDDSMEKRKKSRSKRDKRGSYDNDSSDEDLDRVTKRSKRGKKWYSSEEHSSSIDDESDDALDRRDSKKQKKRRKNKNSLRDDERSRRIRHSSKKYSSSGSEETEDGERESGDVDIVRKEIGLDWMLKPAGNTDKRPALITEIQPEQPSTQEVPRVNPRELNPYLRNNGSGYPDEVDEAKTAGDSLLSSSLVGDGGASWRLKALKRAKEQAAREGRNLEEVVEERWGPLGQLAVSVASHAAAPSRAHLHAIRNRQKWVGEENENNIDGENKKNLEQNTGQSYLKDVSVRNPGMRAPKVQESLSWRKKQGFNMSRKNDGLIAAAASRLNKFADDGSFMSNFRSGKTDNNGEASGASGDQEGNLGGEEITSEITGTVECGTSVKEPLSANQLAAKALQLRMKGRHKEAEELMQAAANTKAKQGVGETSSGLHRTARINKHAIQDVSARKMEDDADRTLAQKIIQNKRYSLSGHADDEYDYELAPSKRSQKKSGVGGQKASERNGNAQRFLTQQERCIFCFENPNRPKHLVVSIANLTYMMLPQWQPVVPGHCCILPLQHESATRNVDNGVWEEIRNFKKCLIMMFAKQDKEMVFLETVLGLGKQRRHCLIECIPLPCEIAKQAPLYFKKAIDEAEDEWSQHNAKKLIDTSERGLRHSIPKDFPYFHVEFGLNKGFVHVIDDEKQFKSSLGLNVIRGMLRLPEEDMYRHRRHESVDTQKLAVANFLRDWQPFDWTKQLE